MKNIHSLIFAVIFAVCLPMMVGCGDGGNIQISYFQPAKVNVPEKIHKLAVADFGSDNRQDGRYGEIASDKLESALDEYNQKYHRYQLVDRKNLKKILDEKDWQRAINDASAASDAGKIAKVDAIIYGSVKVRAQAVQATKTELAPVKGDPFHTKTVSYIKHVVTVVMAFTMDDVTTSRSLVTKTITENYDSDKDSKDTSFAGMFSSGDDKKSLEEATNVLIDKCVQQFVNMISPHDVTFVAKLARGKTKAVDRGNKYAVTGDYVEALACYKDGITEKSDDDGAVYNAGVALEAMGKCKEAADYYARAIRMNSSNKEYFKARQRVREFENNGPVEAVPTDSGKAAEGKTKNSDEVTSESK